MTMKARIMRIVSLILGVSLLLAAIPLAAVIISKFTKDDNKDDLVISLSESDNSELINYANSLANDVNMYYGNALGQNIVIENQNMNLYYNLATDDGKQVTNLTNSKGDSYLQNTMDVFVEMNDGKTYYSSQTAQMASANVFRFGYYYYDVRVEGQNFVNDIIVNSKHSIPFSKFTGNSSCTVESIADGLKVTITDHNDPFIYANSGIDFDTTKYSHIRTTIKAPDLRTEDNPDAYLSAVLFLVAGEYEWYHEKQKVPFNIIADGEYHTYDIALNSIWDYNGTARKLRFDFGTQIGQEFEISEISALSTSTGGVAYLTLAREFHAYSNKLNHVIQVTAQEDTNNISKIGMVIKIDANTVNKFVIKDQYTQYTQYEDFSYIDWDSVEYIGLDIKDVGIFGYILPKDNTSGKLKLEIKDNQYIITQYRKPSKGTVYKPTKDAGNSKDFYMGQRIYTDDTHTFTKFLHEAECERNPLKSKHIKVNTTNSTEGKYVKYDALRGVYTFTLDGTEFNSAYHDYPNRHYNISFSIIGDEVDRDIYVLALTKAKGLESAVLLDKTDMMLPVPVEVCKNYVGDNDNTIYNFNDDYYSESVFPMLIRKQETNKLNMVTMYQNWGDYPVKQLSSIQYFCPYYHLSTGVTETNCITPYIGTRLPDHRSMSAPLWAHQPQHSSAGMHRFVQYTDSSGKNVYEVNTKNTINSYGPTYADVDMEYITSDGKMKIKYKHLEMPQTDENRAYYVMEYEVLEDITINDFRKDFVFYSVESNNQDGTYTQVGYLDGSNTSRIITLNSSTIEKGYILGNQSPYISYFNMKDKDGYPIDDYVNLSFLIKDYSFVIGGKQVDANFMLKTGADNISLTLNLRATTLKAGDKFSINAIIMPWGSQETDYSTVSPDKNVRDVRLNTLINPIQTSAGADAQIISDPYLPKIKTTNGKSAEFALSRPSLDTEHNLNTTVNVYGFTELVKPSIYELINGEWHLCQISSIDNPDKAKYAYNYDGYGVMYENDGTYTYSFVTTITSGSTRRFKVVIQKSTNRNCNLYYDAVELAEASNTNSAFNDVKILNSGEYNFVRLYGNGTAQEAVLNLYKDGKVTTGQYFAIKYRLASSNTEDAGKLEVFASTTSSKPSGKGDVFKIDTIKDGEWHTVVVNIEEMIAATEKVADGTYQNQYTATNEKYSAKYLRLDVFNQVMSTSSYIDIAFVAMCDNFEIINSL